MFKYFFKREINDKYLGNLTGIAWVFIQPIITLSIYWLVFEKIFGATGPEGSDVGFIVYLAVGFWPWLAFSESILRSITTVSDKSDFIGKINLDLKIPVIATVTANFSLNMIGYVVVLIGLVLYEDKFNYASIGLLILPVIQLYLLAIALGLLLSSIQIFIRDTLQFMTTIMTLWFFMTPIIYSETILPAEYKSIIQLNPVYTPISFIHNAIITNTELPWLNMGILSIFIIILLYLSIKTFDKLAPRFEDFK